MIEYWQILNSKKLGEKPKLSVLVLQIPPDQIIK